MILFFAILELAPAFTTAVVPPALRRRKCQAESTHVTQRKHNQNQHHCYSKDCNMGSLVCLCVFGICVFFSLCCCTTKIYTEMNLTGWCSGWRCKNRECLLPSVCDCPAGHAGVMTLTSWWAGTPCRALHYLLWGHFHPITHLVA